MIVDASVAFKWVFVEEYTDRANALLERDDLIAPNFLMVELGNALWNKARQGELGDRTVLAMRLALAASLVTLVADTEVIPNALDIAFKLDHAIYDCVYLALAVSNDDVLITADRKFANKVGASQFANSVRLL